MNSTPISDVKKNPSTSNEGRRAYQYQGEEGKLLPQICHGPIFYNNACSMNTKIKNHQQWVVKLQPKEGVVTNQDNWKVGTVRSGVSKSGTA